MIIACGFLLAVILQIQEVYSKPGPCLPADHLVERPENLQNRAMKSFMCKPQSLFVLKRPSGEAMGIRCISEPTCAVITDKVFTSDENDMECLGDFLLVNTSVTTGVNGTICCRNPESGRESNCSSYQHFVLLPRQLYALPPQSPTPHILHRTSTELTTTDSGSGQQGQLEAATPRDEYLPGSFPGNKPQDSCDCDCHASRKTQAIVQAQCANGSLGRLLFCALQIAIFVVTVSVAIGGAVAIERRYPGSVSGALVRVQKRSGASPEPHSGKLMEGVTTADQSTGRTSPDSEQRHLLSSQ